jgi:hypothetical protein
MGMVSAVPVKKDLVFQMAYVRMGMVSAVPLKLDVEDPQVKIIPPSQAKIQNLELAMPISAKKMLVLFS